MVLRVMKAIDHLPATVPGKVLANQLMRSASSVAANYRAACRAKSRADFISKLGIVEEEADETIYWMELLLEADLVKADKLVLLIQEANELVAITVASINTAWGNPRRERE